MTRSRHPKTRVVVPIDILEAPVLADDDAREDDLDCFFDDPELTRQLRAVKQGRGISIALLVGSALALTTAITLFT